MESLDFLQETEKQLAMLLEQFSGNISAVMFDMESQRADLDAARKELDSREANVIRMEKVMREHLQNKEEMERQLQDASSRQNTAVLRETVLENEKSKLQEMLEQMEKRLQEIAGEKDRLAGKVAELTIVNQKLADEKAKLLKLQLEQGGK